MGDVDVFKKVISGEKPCKNNSLINNIYIDGLKSFRISDKIICLSSDTFQILTESYFVDSSKIRVIPNGLEDARVPFKRDIRQLYNIPKNDKVLLFVGRVCRQKGVFDLLTSFKHVLSSFPNCWLIIAGSINHDCISMIEDEVRTHVLILGVQTKERLYELYQMVDIGILPSYYEQCSYTGIEMQMFGLPIVASNSFGVRCMFNATNAIIYKINRNDPKSTIAELSEKILYALTLSRKDIEILKRKARFQYESIYTHEKMSMEYKQVIMSL